jgi:Na+-transporting methylmalonyl-CoA/oxaloacetate decarboxylase gamma subunit
MLIIFAVLGVLYFAIVLMDKLVRLKGKEEKGDKK